MSKKSEVDGSHLEKKLPIFRVKFEKNTKISDVKKVRSLCWCRITWEKNIPSSIVTQCFKCQAFEHISNNCFRKEICANCAGQHNTKTCDIQRSIIKCANCGGDHKASDIQCESYIRAINRKTRPIVNNNNRSLPSQVNNTRTSTSVSSSYAKIVRNREVDDRLYSSNNNNREQQNQEDDVSISSIISELKLLFKNFDFKKMINSIKNIVTRMRSCDDTVSKIACIFEGLCELFE